jgi:NAD(P)-dependent dehydrogenase (short-subunit alcohol dehydrogenase family)
MQDFAGRVAVVTGGASGIGLGLVRRFRAEGMRVVIGDIEAGPLDAAVAELRDAGVEVEGLVTDVSDAAQVQALADAAVARFGGVHVVCNNAASRAAASRGRRRSTREWVLGVTLWGVINGIRSFVPLLVQQDAGHVVDTASVAGLVAGPFMGPYNASKHAVVALSETLLHELAIAAPHVHVSVLCPGWVDTRIGESDRNRPDRLAGEFGGEGAGGGPGLGLLQGVLERGMPPAVVAEQVVDAVRADRFWIRTHDREAESWVDAVNRRGKTIIDRTNPAFGVPL